MQVVGMGGGFGGCFRYTTKRTEDEGPDMPDHLIDAFPCLVLVDSYEIKRHYDTLSRTFFLSRRAFSGCHFQSLTDPREICREAPLNHH